jgi:hypothetical protein
MKVKYLSFVTGVSGLLIMNSNAAAAPQLVVVSANTTNAFLVANDLQSIVIGITGFARGENLQGFIGANASPWSLTIGNIIPPGGYTDTFFNVDSNEPYFDGQGQTAANALNAPPNGIWDTGVLAHPTTNALGAITSGGTSNPIGFAQFGVNYNFGPGSDVFWLSLNPTGIGVSGTVPLFRFTFHAADYAVLNLVCVTNFGSGQGGEYPLTIGFGFIPTPGAAPLLIAASIFGMRRRRLL